MVNRSLPAELYKGQGGLGSSVSVLRTGAITVTARDNFVHFTLPVQLTFGYAMYESHPLRTDLRFKARIQVNPDWRLKSEVYYVGATDGLADTIKLGPLSLKPRSIVEGISQPVQRMLAPIIDDKINGKIQLRSKVVPLWENAFTPRLVNREFSTWLKLTPKKIVISPLVAADNRIRISVGMITGAEIVVGPQPAAAPVSPLPPVQQAPSYDRNFHIQLASEVHFSDLVAALKPVLLNKTFGTEKKITIRDFHLKGEGGRLVVVLSASGDFDGELTLLARPVSDAQKNSLTFEDVDFDTKDAGFLMTTASWLFGSTIRDTIKSKLDTAVAEQLEQARLKASVALASVQVADRLKLNGSVSSLSLGDSIVLDDRLSLQVIARGETIVKLD